MHVLKIIGAVCDVCMYDFERGGWVKGWFLGVVVFCG